MPQPQPKPNPPLVIVKPDPNMLGSGGAARAGLAISGRKKQLDDAIAASGG